MSPRMQRFSALLIYILMRVLLITYRVRFVGSENRQIAEKKHRKRGFAMGLWHEQQCAGILTHRHQPLSALASLSSDGEIVTQVMRRFGLQTVRGSSSRGGPKARDQLVAAIDQGRFIAITVDGPRGPRRRVRGGIVDIARRTEVAILPMVTMGDRNWELSSWDRFKIPKPFARIVVVYGKPIDVPSNTRGLTFGKIKNDLRRGLETVEREAIASLTRWRHA